MKIISKEREEEHYNSVLRGGAIGGVLGLAAGLVGVIGAGRRYPAFRSLTLPFRAFLVSSSTTFGAIIVAERNSISFSRAADPMFGYQDQSQRIMSDARKAESGRARALDWARDNRYTIVVSSWAAAVSIALVLVGRNKFLTTPQKLVQARVYAQGLTLAVLLATATLEVSDARKGKGRWETVLVVDPNDPEHRNLIEKRVHREEYEGQDLWMDMVASEERRLAKAKKEKAAAPTASEASANDNDNDNNNKVGAAAVAAH
ncbi:mitochondrial hypoxia responsive domain containing protein [Niveomyces insectorum RCEF 264]|uniref:Mitochondrial hypoxia responsive domain containing protein n=1 Tax=Niveomyces insectorum RCEF 264 TaxID=1081102 RepID=A0A167N035_9HYPO|nr:mitochondrial hypoxia responsive domain containing protein [Niveomyces insectorum RCEF 264]